MTSIIILTKDNLKYSKDCIESIFEYTSQVKTPFEIIVVDNGSKDGTVAYLKSLETVGQIKAIYNPENLGFPKGVNQGVAIAKGEYLCLLNNDTVMTAGWLESLIRCIKSDPTLAATGPYSSYSSGHQMSPIKCDYTGNEQLQKFAARYSQVEKYVDFLVFFCCLIKKSVWSEIGGLDEAFSPGNWEDNFFCWQAIQKGYKLKVCGNAFIHHYVHTSWNTKDPKKRAEFNALLARNQKLFLRKIGQYKTIALCMIVSDKENPLTLKRCIDSVIDCVDEICIVFNYRGLFYKTSLEKEILKTYNCPEAWPNIVKREVVKWKDNFSWLRNLSIDMAQSDFILWLDCDDIFHNALGIRQLIQQNPEVDAFRCKITSHTEIKTAEIIFHNRLFKNKPGYKFVNRVHEDIAISLKECSAKIIMTSLEIHHYGYTHPKVWRAKNKRNYQLLMMDYKEKKTTLNYYHIANALIILGGEKNLQQAIRYIDEMFETLKPGKDDPITSKMWMVRGVCCHRAGQLLAAKQSYHKAFDEWQQPEAAVSLGDIYLGEGKYDKAIEILETISKKEGINVGTSIDLINLESVLFEKLGDAYAKKAQKEKSKELFLKAGEAYRNSLYAKKENLKAADRLCQILRNTGRAQEAAVITVNYLQMFPAYHVGWFNLGQAELSANRPETAKVFFKQALSINPKYPEARHNYSMLMKMGRKK